MFPKFTNIFEGISYDIRGNADWCEILAFRGLDRFHVKVLRADTDGRNPALVALQKMEEWFAHGEHSETTTGELGDPILRVSKRSRGDALHAMCRPD